MFSERAHRRQFLGGLVIVLALATPSLRADASDDPPAVPAQPSPPEQTVEPSPEPSTQTAPTPALTPGEPSEAQDPEATAEQLEPPVVEANTEAPAGGDEAREPANELGAAPDENAPNPCAQQGSFKEAWIDKVRRGVFYTVCGSAAWFDNFFGDERTYDPTQVYGKLSAGLLHEATGEWKDRSKFNANIPLPNVSKRTSAFLGRDDPEEFISDQATDLSTPEAFRSGTDDRSWLAGFGYSPPGKRGARLNFRLGGKVSSNPYAFVQARYRYTRYTSRNTAFRFHETVFYRTNDDELGCTTYAGYDWVPRRNFMARVSTQVTVTQDTDGAKWKSYATLYEDLALRSGSPRGLAYQLIANGETDDVPLREYGFLGIYREQVFRPWLFAEATLGYSWVKEEPELSREGGLTVGFVFEILFGDYYARRF